jgi:HEAT repeat protein
LCSLTTQEVRAQKKLEQADRMALQRLPLEIRTLLEDWRSFEKEKKQLAEKKLAQIGAGAVETLPIFEEALKEENWRLRRFALRILSRFSPPRTLMPLLLRATSDKDYKVREAAMEALRPLGRESLSVYLAVLDQNDWWKMRWLATKAIGELGESAAQRAMPILQDALQKDREERVRLGIIESLSELGTAGVSLLRQVLLREQKSSMRLAAVHSLERLGSKASSAVQELTRAIQDEDRNVRTAAARALANVGGAAIPALIKLLKFGTTPEERRIAARALGNLRAIGVPALPILADSLRDPDEGVREATLIAIGEMGAPALPHLSNALRKSREWKARWLAAKGLQNLGIAAKPAIPSLVKALNDPNRSVQEEAALALASIGKEGVGALSQAAQKHPWWRIRQIATRGIQKKEQTSERSLRLLEAAIRDPIPQVREEAARSLAKQDASAIPTILKILRETKEANLRYILFEGLQAHQEKAAPAASLLEEALQEKDTRVQISAIQALQKIGTEGIVVLRRALQSHSWWRVRYLSAEALGAWKKDPLGSQEALAKGIRDQDRRVREISIRSLGRLGRASLPTLRQGLQNDWWFIRARSIRYIVALQTPEALSLITPLLDDRNEQVREVAIKKLADIGSAALPSLIGALMQTRWPSLRSLAAIEIGRFAENAQSALPALQKAAEDKDASLRLPVIQTLGLMGSAAAPATPTLGKRLLDDDPRVRLAALYALQRVGEDAAKEALPHLQKSLYHADTKVQIGSVQTIEAMGKKAIPLLRDALKKHPNDRVRQAAAKALGSYDPPEKATFDALISALGDDNSETREEAARTLGRLGGKTAIAALEKSLLVNTWWKTRQIAAESLGSLHKTRSLKSLKQALDDTDNRVRIAVIHAIGEIAAFSKNKRRLSLLKKILVELKKLKDEEDDALQNTAKRTIERIEEALSPKRKK